jgi:hypothetical protein
MKRFWIKLYLEMLDDDKFGALQEYMKWRAVELFLVAGENGDDGLLPPVDRLAWRIRLPIEKLLETLSALAEVGIVTEAPEGWKITNFKKRQYSESYERVKRYRNGKSNATVSDNGSLSNSISPSISSEEGGMGGETQTPIEAEFIAHFGCFNSPGERKRWETLVESVGFEKAQGIASWAESKEIHMTNRGGLLTSMETAAKNDFGNKPHGKSKLDRLAEA